MDEPALALELGFNEDVFPKFHFGDHGVLILENQLADFLQSEGLYKRDDAKCFYLDEDDEHDKETGLTVAMTAEGLTSVAVILLKLVSEALALLEAIATCEEDLVPGYPKESLREQWLPPVPVDDDPKCKLIFMWLSVAAFRLKTSIDAFYQALGSIDQSDRQLLADQYGLKWFSDCTNAIQTLHEPVCPWYEDRNSFTSPDQCLRVLGDVEARKNFVSAGQEICDVCCQWFNRAQTLELIRTDSRNQSDDFPFSDAETRHWIRLFTKTQEKKLQVSSVLPDALVETPDLILRELHWAAAHKSEYFGEESGKELKVLLSTKDNYRVVTWGNATFQFREAAAKAVKAIHEATIEGKGLPSKKVLDAAGSYGREVRDLFRIQGTVFHDAWETMIVKTGSRRKTEYWIAEPKKL